MMPEQCADIQSWLSEYLHGETDAARRAAIDAHLAACPACRAELEAQRALTQTLAAWCVPTVDPQLSVRFADAMATRTTARRSWLPRFAWLGALGAAALVALCLLPGPRHPLTSPPKRVAIRTFSTQCPAVIAPVKPATNAPMGDRVSPLRKISARERPVQRVARKVTRPAPPAATPTPDAGMVMNSLLAETPVMETEMLAPAVEQPVPSADAVVVALWAETE